MFNKILVPLDGSALAAAALLPASALAKHDQAELVLVGAATTPHVAEIDAYLATMVNCLSADDLTVRAIVPRESPEGASDEATTFAQADLIVMTTHGHTGLDAQVHPNVTWRLLAQTIAPVLVTRFAEEERQAPSVHQLPFMVDSTAPILVPLDGTRSAERVLPLVRDIALAFGNPVVLVQAGDPLLLAEGPCGMELAPGGAASYWQAEAQAYLDEKEAELTKAGVHVTSLAVLGLPAAVIQATAQEYEAGMIIMASHGRGWLGRLVLGSVTTEVLSQSETPVLVVRQCAPEPVKEGQIEQVLAAAGTW